MTDVHEVYVEKRRWRFWPIVTLILVALLAIGVLIAMIMNIHGSIAWPAGEVRFGFWPATTTTEAAPATIAPPARVATEIAPPPAPAPQVQPVQEEAQPNPAPQSAQPAPPPATPPAESDPAPPAESRPLPLE